MLTILFAVALQYSKRDAAKEAEDAAAGAAPAEAAPAEAAS